MPSRSWARLVNRVVRLSPEQPVTVDLSHFARHEQGGVLFFTLRALDDARLTGAAWLTGQAPKRLPLYQVQPAEAAAVRRAGARQGAAAPGARVRPGRHGRLLGAGMLWGQAAQAGAQQYLPMSAAVRGALSAAVAADRSAPEPQFTTIQEKVDWQASMSDRLPRRNILAAIYALRGLGFFALVLVGAHWELYVAASIGGMVWAGSIALSSAILADVYGVRLVGVLYGLVYVGHQIGGMLSAWLGGWGYEHIGTHWIAFGLAGGLLLTAAVVAMQLPGQRPAMAAA